MSFTPAEALVTVTMNHFFQLYLISMNYPYHFMQKFGIIIF